MGRIDVITRRTEDGKSKTVGTVGDSVIGVRVIVRPPGASQRYTVYRMRGPGAMTELFALIRMYEGRRYKIVIDGKTHSPRNPVVAKRGRVG